MTVALILTPSFDSLSELVKTMPVWAVDVPENRRPCSIPTERSYRDWLTFYTPSQVIELNEECLGQIESIETHYPTLSTIFLIGLERSTNLELGLSSLGYDIGQSGALLVAHRRANQISR